jgi:hypothetical protein
MDLTLNVPSATRREDSVRDEAPLITGGAAQSQTDSDNEVYYEHLD